MISLFLAAMMCSSKPDNPDTRCYELRTYTAAPGRMDDLLARFRNHTVKLFEKHGLTNVGYWTPVDRTDNRLIYLLSSPSRDAHESAFREFGADPEWQRVFKESEADGKLVEKIDSVFLTATDYSPAIKPHKTKLERVFELRIYSAASDKLGDLNARFRNHTAGLFKKHGMTNFGYWTPMDNSRGAQDTLVYMLIHRNSETAAASWEAFRKDPAWIAARDESEKNGKLLKKNPESVYLHATDFSPAR